MCEASPRTETGKLTRPSKSLRPPTAALRAKVEATFAEQLRSLSAFSDIAEHDLGYRVLAGLQRTGACSELTGAT